MPDAIRARIVALLARGARALCAAAAALCLSAAGACARGQAVSGLKAREFFTAPAAAALAAAAARGVKFPAERPLVVARAATAPAAAPSMAARHGQPSAPRPTMSAPPGAPTAHAAAPDTLDVRALLPVIARADAGHAALLRTRPAVATYARLPFYADAGLLRVAVLGPQPIGLRYVYAPGERRAFNTGTPTLVRAANAAAGLRLTPGTAVAYVRFYLEVAGNAGWAGRRLAASADEVPWLATTETDPEARAARARLSRQIPAAAVAPAPHGGLRVTAAVVRGRAIEVVPFTVAADGTVIAGPATTVTDAAPVVQLL